MWLAGAGGNAADDSADLKALNVAVSGRQLECNLQKNSLAARRAQAELDSKGQPDSAKTKRSKVCSQRGFRKPVMLIMLKIIYCWSTMKRERTGWG